MVAVVVSALGLLGVALAATRRPAWYRPAAIDYARLHEDKVALAELEQQISAALNSGQSIRIQLTEDQINRWLAARGEVWPGGELNVGPLTDPVVRLTEEGVQIGGQVSKRGLMGIVSAVLHVRVSGDEVRLAVATARVGALSVPAGWLMRWGGPADRVHLDPGTSECVLGNQWVWPNGKRRFRVADLRFVAGGVEVVLEPAGLDRRDGR